ncbi:aldolase catalytic domain-containing protein [Cellulophaga sp. L1A9]|uniref:aldolase catalytic domain-containing protein n=1 Tax=Cellulophaga sp. L1A9 TaxID=2686362 RepID=UPI00131DEDC2|nr:aldolase catalytic domain-containing protein [Cellulophaga sp. L1A9]
MSIKNKKFQILDCTLRDGGYYTNWDFDRSLVDDYCTAMEDLPIDYVEIGYRSTTLNGYLGEYFYCPDYLMKDLKSKMPNKKLVIILDEKNIKESDINKLMEPCKPYISLVRLAVSPLRVKNAVKLAIAIKKLGFEVAFNVMYMSDWKNNPEFIESLHELNDHIDYFYMVDSFGAVLPNDVIDILNIIKPKLTVPIGFHGHNNLEMALINSLTAIENGVELIDCTITGMGRGAGNLRTELFLTYLNSIDNKDIKFFHLGKTVSNFETLKKSYEWGTNLPYMFSGAYSLPQKQVMEWVGMNRYPISNIVNALNNQKEDVKDNLKLPKLDTQHKFKKAIILGGGDSVIKIDKALEAYLKQSENTCIIHAGVKHVEKYINNEIKQFYALVGFESEKLLKQLGNKQLVSQICIYPPYPRKMGTIILDKIKNISFELDKLNFTQSSEDSPMVVAVQAAIDLGVEEILLAGFDGYNMDKIDQTQFNLANENQSIINDVVKLEKITTKSITPTKYKNLETTSIFNYL